MKVYLFEDRRDMLFYAAHPGCVRWYCYDVDDRFRIESDSDWGFCLSEPEDADGRAIVPPSMLPIMSEHPGLTGVLFIESGTRREYGRKNR